MIICDLLSSFQIFIVFKSNASQVVKALQFYDKNIRKCSIYDAILEETWKDGKRIAT